MDENCYCLACVNTLYQMAQFVMSNCSLVTWRHISRWSLQAQVTPVSQLRMTFSPYPTMIWMITLVVHGPRENVTSIAVVHICCELEMWRLTLCFPLQIHTYSYFLNHTASPHFTSILYSPGKAWMCVNNSARDGYITITVRWQQGCRGFGI